MLLYFFEGRDSQFSEEAGRGAAGPVISHSWLTVMTDFSCPRASAFESFHTQPCYSFTQLITRKQSCVNSASRRSLLRRKESYCGIDRSTQLRGSGRLLGNRSHTDALGCIALTVLAFFETQFVYINWYLIDNVFLTLCLLEILFETQFQDIEY